MTSQDITPEDSVVPVFLDPTPPEPVEEPPVDIDALRRRAYEDTADPLFFKWQRGEATEQEWLDAVQAVRDQYPKVEG